VPRGNPRGRHSLAHRPLRARRIALVAAPVVTALAVGVGVLTSGFTAPEDTGSAAGNVSAATRPSSGSTPAAASSDARRTLGTSRSVDRVPLVDTRVPKVKGKLWTTANVDLRIEPREKSRNVGLVKSGKQVSVTGKRLGAYTEVVVGRASRWVTSDYLSRNKTPEVMGLSNQPCPDGSGIESAIQPAAVKVYRAACAAFPELTTYGGQDGHGEHVNGEAIDFMVPDASVGQRLADFLYAHHAQLDLFDIIWSQHIWTIQRASEGFRSMSDRGSPTANHYDHVHIKIN
jgi:hypothetical protein